MIPIINNLALDPHQLYHVSPKLFDFPCRTKINEAREWSQWHSNGVLGLWTSTFPNMCKGFGTYSYAVDIKEGSRRIGLPFEDFRKLTCYMEEYTDLIAYLCKHGDVAYLIDATDNIGEVIVLNFNMISRFENVTGSDLADIRYQIKYAE